MKEIYLPENENRDSGIKKKIVISQISNFDYMFYSMKKFGKIIEKERGNGYCVRHIR